MSEACFCGRSGELADREPAYLGDGDWGLVCPRCGHLDPLAWLPPDARAALVGEARHRRAALAEAGSSRATEAAA